MEINQIRYAIQLILSSGDINAKKDVELIISTLENENELRFEVAITPRYESCLNEHFDKINKTQEKRQIILEKYGIEPI